MRAVLWATAGLVVLVAALAALAGCGESTPGPAPASASRTHGTITLTYAIEPVSGAVTAADVHAVAALVRRRLVELGSPGAVSEEESTLIVTLPATFGDDPSTKAYLARGAQLGFYDWEPDVVGPGGETSPAEGSVTGDTTSAGAGSAQGGLTEYRAVLRGAERAPRLRANDTTWWHGCTSAQVEGCAYGSWYLVDARHERMLCAGNQPTCPARQTRAELFAGGYQPPAGTSARAVRVEPGTVLVRARPVEGAGGQITDASPNSWYVLEDDPVMTGTDVTEPHRAQGSTPVVAFGFTPRGRGVFEGLTRRVAQRGAASGSEQHFALVLDGRLLAAPGVDYRRYPEGIEAAGGSQIAGDYTTASADELANEMSAGAPPVRLTLLSQSS